MATVREVGHYNGDEHCSESCHKDPNVRHIGDPPAGWGQATGGCCPDCGGNANACWPVCTDTGGRRYEEWEGRTGWQEVADVSGAVDGMGYVHSDADGNL